MNELAKKMSALVLEFEQSGMTQKGFCRSIDMSFHRFNYWFRKLRQETASSSPPSFIEVRKDTAAPSPSLEVVYPNGVRILVPQGHLGVISSLVKLY